MAKKIINQKYELIPTDSHKSFYGKAIVYGDNFGNKYLRSYDTIVATMDRNGKVTRNWGGWSATTGRHIKSFCGMNKAEFTALPYKAGEWADGFEFKYIMGC